MSATEIRKTLRQVPFKPFYLIIDSGKTVLVSHPEAMAVSARGKTCFVLFGRGRDEDWILTDIDHIRAISYESPSKNGRPKRRGRRT